MILNGPGVIFQIHLQESLAELGDLVDPVCLQGLEKLDLGDEGILGRLSEKDVPNFVVNQSFPELWAVD